MSTSIDRYSGDPKVYLDGHGAFLKWVAGQPIMDSGIENCATLPLLIKDDWPGNVFIADKKKQLGSGFVEANEKPVSISMLNNVRSVGERVLKEKMVDDGLARDVTLTVTSPQSTRIKTIVTVTRAGGEEETIQFDKYGPNWEQQRANPAGAR